MTSHRGRRVFVVHYTDTLVGTIADNNKGVPSPYPYKAVMALLLICSPVWRVLSVRCPRGLC